MKRNQKLLSMILALVMVLAMQAGNLTAKLFLLDGSRPITDALLVEI